MTHIVFQKQDTHDTSYVLHLQVATSTRIFPGTATLRPGRRGPRLRSKIAVPCRLDYLIYLASKLRTLRVVCICIVINYVPVCLQEEVLL